MGWESGRTVRWGTTVPRTHEVLALVELMWHHVEPAGETDTE